MQEKERKEEVERIERERKAKEEEERQREEERKAREVKEKEEEERKVKEAKEREETERAAREKEEEEERKAKEAKEKEEERQREEERKAREAREKEEEERKAREEAERGEREEKERKEREEAEEKKREEERKEKEAKEEAERKAREERERKEEEERERVRKAEEERIEKEQREKWREWYEVYKAGEEEMILLILNRFQESYKKEGNGMKEGEERKYFLEIQVNGNLEIQIKLQLSKNQVKITKVEGGESGDCKMKMNGDTLKLILKGKLLISVALMMGKVRFTSGADKLPFFTSSFDFSNFQENQFEIQAPGQVMVEQAESKPIPDISNDPGNSDEVVPKEESKLEEEQDLSPAGEPAEGEPDDSVASDPADPAAPDESLPETPAASTNAVPAPATIVNTSANSPGVTPSINSPAQNSPTLSLSSMIFSSFQNIYLFYYYSGKFLYLFKIIFSFFFLHFIFQIHLNCQFLLNELLEKMRKGMKK